MPPQDFDLSLSTLWYTTRPPVFPIPSIALHGTNTHTYSWSSSKSYLGVSQTLIVAVRFVDTKRTTKIRLTWEESNPLSTVKAQQKHIPPPADPSEEDLVKASRMYGENIASWAEESVHDRVGDGECWTFTHAALSDIAETMRCVGQTPPLLSIGRSHGHLILSLTAGTAGSNSGLLQVADVRRGDILELKGAQFHIMESAAEVKPVFKKGSMVSEPIQGAREEIISMDKHTAVVVEVEGDRVHVVEQNGAVRKGVGRRVYGLEEMRAGEMLFWRVLGEGYMKPLEPVWED